MKTTDISNYRMLVTCGRHLQQEKASLRGLFLPSNQPTEAVDVLPINSAREARAASWRRLRPSAAWPGRDVISQKLEVDWIPAPLGRQDPQGVTPVLSGRGTVINTDHFHLPCHQ